MADAPAIITYIDSCVMIDILERTPSQSQYVQPLVARGENDRLVFVMSAVGLVECLAGKHLDDESFQRARQFLENPYISMRQVSLAIAARAALLCHEHKLMPVDAVHIATCIDQRIPVLLTRDGDDAKLPKRRKPGKMLSLDGKLQSGNGFLKIITPKEYHDSLNKADAPLFHPPPA